MKRLIWLLFLMPSLLLGQAVRFNSNVYTINASSPQPGALYPVLASASATVAVCNAPATGFTVLNASTNSISGNCTNYATTYTNAAQTATCSAPTQLTRTNSTTCVGNVDPEGGFGAWLAAGTYQYTVTLSYGSFGPYDFTVGGTGGGGGGGTPVGFGAQQYSNLAASAFANGGVYNTDQYATGAGTGQSNFFSSSNCIAGGACNATIPPTSSDTTNISLGFSTSKNTWYETDYRANSKTVLAFNPQINYSGLTIPSFQSMYTDTIGYTEPTTSPIQGNIQYYNLHYIAFRDPGFSNGQSNCGSGNFQWCPSPPHTSVGQWALHSGDSYLGVFNTSGINNLKTSIITWAGTGDSQQEASFDTYAGGCVAPSDECHHWKSVHIDTVPDFVGTLTTVTSIGSANPASPSPMQLFVTPAANSTTQGQGRFLASQTAVTGTDSTPLTAAIVSLIRRPGDTYPYGTLVTATSNLPNSPAQGTLLNDCTVPVQEGGVAIGSNGASGPGAPGTAGCVVTVTSGQFCAVGSWNGASCSGTTVVPVCLAANKWNMFDIGVLLNSVTALSGGQQTLVGTMHRSVPAGGYVFQGGLCGTVMTAQGDTNNNSGQFISGSTFPFIGSFGGNTAVYLNYAASTVWQPIPNPGSQWGSRDTGNSIAHLGFTAINLTRASGTVTATITSGYQNSPQSRLMLNGAIFFNVSGCADSSFNSTAIGNFGFLTGPFPNATNQNQATFQYAQAGPDASGTCPTAVIAMENTSIGIFPAAEVYDVVNHSTAQVDGTFATSYQPAFTTTGQVVEEPTHYQAGVNGLAVSNETAQPIGAGSTSYSSVEHNSASFTGSDFQCNNIPISFQVFSGGGTGQPLPCLQIFGPRLSDIVTDSAPFNGGAVIAVGPPQTAYNWSANVSQFRNYTLIGLDAVSNIYKAAIGFDDDTEAFQFRFDDALGYNPSISFSPLLTNFALPKGGSFAIPVRVPELQFISNTENPMAHIKQCAPLSPTLAISNQLCYATDVPTNAVVTTNTPGSTQWIYILQINDVAGPGYGSPMFLNNGPASLSGSIFNTIPCSDLPSGFTGIIWEFTNPLFNQVGTCSSSSTVLHDTGTYSQSVGPNGVIAGAILGSGGFEATGFLGGFYFSQQDIYGTTTPAETITARLTQKSTGTLSIDTTAQGNSLGNLILNNLTINGTCTGCTGGSGGVTSINTVTGAFTFTGAGVSCTSTTCTFSGSGSSAWSALTNPTGNLALTMGADTSTFTYNATTGTSDLFALTDTASNTGTGIMFHAHTQSGSTEIPWQADSNGVGFQVAANGNLSSVGGTASGALQLSGSTSGTATFTVNAIAGTPTLLAPAQSGTLIAANAEVVSFSSTPVFSNAYNVSRIVLTGNITSFTMNSAIDGGQKTLCFKQGAGPYTVTPPASVHGFFAIGTVNGDWNCQSYIYDNTDSIWLATSLGVINQ